MPFGAVAASVAAPLISGAIGSAFAGGGASQAQGISQEALAKGAVNYTHDQGNTAPYVASGQNALTSIGNLSGLNGADASKAALANFQTSPGYGFAVQQGLSAVDHGAAANGMLRSGETLRAEQTLGNNLANNQFGEYYNRLSGIAGMGLQGAGLQNQSTSTYDGLLGGQSNTAAQTANANGMNQASIYGNAINGAAGGVTNAARNGLFSTAMGGGGGLFGGAGVSGGGFGF